MKCVAKVMVGLLGYGALATVAKAIVPEAIVGNPYQAIVERNVFDLKPPPPPAAPPSVTNTPPPNVKLTGITSILGNKRALFMVQDAAMPGKPPGKEESYILTEGQRQGMLEVVEINEKAGTVKIKNDGNVSVVTFDQGVKLPSAPAAGGIPGMVGGPGQAHMPNFAPPPQPLQPSQAFNPQASFGGNSPADNAQNAIPTRTLRTEPQLSPEEQVVMMEVERERTKDLVNQGQMPPLPPTIITPGAPPEPADEPPGTSSTSSQPPSTPGGGAPTKITP